jgi:dienelactone hydrolase
MTGQLARPSGAGPHPGVLVMHSALGLGEQVRDRARDLADLGYVALATDVYGVGGELSREDAGPHFLGLQNDPVELRTRLRAGYDALAALPDVDTARIAAIGYCFGGQCALELARSGAPVAAVVSFHGLLRTGDPAVPGVVRATVLSLSGAQDPYVPAEDVAQFQQEMTDAGVDWQVTVYGKGQHSFTDPQTRGVPGAAYDPVLDRLSWEQAVAFLDAALAEMSVP